MVTTKSGEGGEGGALRLDGFECGGDPVSKAAEPGLGGELLFEGTAAEIVANPDVRRVYLGDMYG